MPSLATAVLACCIFFMMRVCCCSFITAPILGCFDDEVLVVAGAGVDARGGGAARRPSRRLPRQRLLQHPHVHRPRRHQPPRLRRLHARAHPGQPRHHRQAPRRHLLVWWFMLVNIGIIFLTGGILGWLAVLVLRPPHHLRGLVIASCSAANLGNLLLIVIPAVCEEHDGSPGPFGNKTICTRRGLSYASFSMALGGFYIWTHTHSVMKRSGQIYRRMKRANIAADATCLVDPPKDDRSAASLSEEEVAQDQVPSCWNKNDEDDVISPSPESVQDKIIMQHQILLPLLSSYRLSGKSNNNLWEKLKEGTLQILEELTAPPTIGAVTGLVVGAVPWLKSVFVGSNAPLRAVHNSLKLLGDGTIPCVTLILGGNLTKGVRKTAVPPEVVAAIIGVRYMILPVTGIVVVKAAREMGFLPPDPLYQYVLMIQFALPPAMSIGTMAQLYDVGQEECSVIFLWTYLVAALALTVWSTIFMSILLHHP